MEVLLMSEPAISVIIPMFNAEKYIRQCLISVLSQKLQDFEAIVIDDCS
ncbi:MAG: glycosyltransferase, partial [Selenomonadaceae bacterium]|nr:glycosyltransferase [Selenomonadaceae bacterium]